MFDCSQCKMVLHTFCQEINSLRNEWLLFLSCLLSTYLSFVALVGAETFMRFLSWRISQHHLHLHSVHRPAVEQRHGLVCTLEPERHREEGRCQFRVKYMYIYIYLLLMLEQKAASPVCQHTWHIQPSSQEWDGSPTGNQSDWRHAEKEKVTLQHIGCPLI